MKNVRTRRIVDPLQGNGEDPHTIVKRLTDGVLTVEGLLPWGSNYTFLARVTDDGGSELAVYKPVRGERPLWDFPHGTLAEREVAAYVVSDALGWNFVPPTVLREGPHGVGSVQQYVDIDPDAHFFTFRDDPNYAVALREMALFDVVVNNADRKGGHCLKVPGGRLWGIDHGVCFNAQPKLRTVIWDFASEPVPAEQMSDLCRLQGELERSNSITAQRLLPLLSREEFAALRARLTALVEKGRFPAPPENRRPFPWPLV